MTIKLVFFHWCICIINFANLKKNLDNVYFDGAFKPVNFLPCSGNTLVKLLFEGLKFEGLSTVTAPKPGIEILAKKGFLKFVTFVFCCKDQMSKRNECMNVSGMYNALGIFYFSVNFFFFGFYLIVLTIPLVFFHWWYYIINCAN